MGRWFSKTSGVALALGLAVACHGRPVAAATPLPGDESILPSEGYIKLINGRFVLLQEEPAESRQPEAARQPELASDIVSLTSATQKRGGGFLEDLAVLEQAQVLPAAAGTPREALSPQQMPNPPIDLAGALQQSDTVQTVNTQLRNPASLDPRVRGYRYAQIYTQADGAYWIPVRQDLDTPLSMFDPSIVRAIEVVPGPYSLQYGPGLSYLNVVTAPTPRYDRFEAHGFTSTDFYSNGYQLNATQRIYGGNTDWGFSFLHGTRDGNHYTSGNGTEIPSRYNNEDLFTQFGFDLDIDRHVEFRYLRQDQTDTQYPGQFFKTNIAITQGWTLQYVDESADSPWNKLVTEGWYNIGRLQGATDPGEHIFDVVSRVNLALTNAGVGPNPNFSATTNASTFTTGGRVATVYGEDGERQLTVGTDFRYVNQYVNENLQYFDNDVPVPFSTGLPRSYMVDPGAFAEYTIPMASYWDVTLGARVDWVLTDLDGPLPPNYPHQLGDQLNQNNVLYSFFLTNEVELDENWSTRFGFGQAQRPPSLTERYADGEFLALIQSGFSRLIGKPNLTPERLWQLDAALVCDTDDFRGRLSGFYSLIQNFSTFATLPLADPTGARLLFTESTPLATLAGFEAYAERDLSSYWTAFLSGLYVSGRDQTLSAPLTQIYPLEGRAGLRLHDPAGGNRWGIEMFARVVDQQDRLGTLRDGFQPDQKVVIELPTAGFTVWNLRGYWNANEHWNFVGGINNVFDRNYLEHLSLRFAPGTVPAGNTVFPGVAVLSPGFTPYIGIDATY